MHVQQLIANLKASDQKQELHTAHTLHAMVVLLSSGHCVALMLTLLIYYN